MMEKSPDLPVENVQSYPRPPAVEAVPQRIRIRLGGVLIVDTNNALRVLETHHPPTYYIPREELECDLRPVQGGSFCEWKGVARYFDVSAGRITRRHAAWCYDDPTSAFSSIRHHLAFYATKMDSCHVGDMRVDAQAGDFYGGWITANLSGFPKGAPGTEHW
ncbi:DUF427 domain-containing protein [Roseibium sp. MMSF_3544]|uniref:DUF427 domain-containing protein n=1 Tax=unclassified Roseibium TaxID=2629323 RepID=UPI00273E0163|nr:DUF427 domain-containing protein [Roseibium sp. MMSF_3544]